MESKTPPSREELAKRLQQMSLEKKLPMRHRERSAMCYSIRFEEKVKTFVCERCGKTYEVTDYGNHEIEYEYINKFRKLGFDAKIEYICNECFGSKATTTVRRNKKSKKIDKECFSLFGIFDNEKENDEYETVEVPYSTENEIFLFRFNDTEPYVESRGYELCSTFNYNILLHFLENKHLYSTYSEKCDGGSDYYIDEYRDMIQSLTGIKLTEDQLHSMPLTQKDILSRLSSNDRIFIIGEHHYRKPVLFYGVCSGCGRRTSYYCDEKMLFFREHITIISNMGYDIKMRNYCEECVDDHGYRYRWRKPEFNEAESPRKAFLSFAFRVPKNVTYCISESGEMLLALENLLRGRFNADCFSEETKFVTSKEMAKFLGLSYEFEKLKNNE